MKTSCVFEKVTRLKDTMRRTWDLAPAQTQYQPSFGERNNSEASTISNFGIKVLWAELSLDKRTSGPYSLKKGNYLCWYYCVMDPICWWPEKHGVQYTMFVKASRYTGGGVPVWWIWCNLSALLGEKNETRKLQQILNREEWSGMWRQKQWSKNV